MIIYIDDHWWHPDTRQWSIPDNEGAIQAVREAMKEQTDKPYTVEVLNLDDDEKKAKLENEKEKLLSRIEEIDRELAKLGGK